MKLLIVDDERIPREGLRRTIARLFPDIDILPLAANGEEALALCLEHTPDVVVTDIRMPGMDGLDLIDTLREKGFEGEFVIVSGYDSFEYASRAIKIGIKHYILKPCKEADIQREIASAMADVNKRVNLARHLEQMQRDMTLWRAQLRQQFLQSLLFGAGHDPAELRAMQARYGFEAQEVTLCVVAGDEDADLQQALWMKQAVDQVLADYPENICALHGDKIVFIVDSSQGYDLQALGESLVHLSGAYSTSPVYIAIGESGSIEQTPMLYRQAVKMLDHRFFAEGSLVITPQLHASSGIPDGAPDMVGVIEAVTQAVAMGETAQYTQLVEQFFAFFRTAKTDMGLARTYCLELLMGIVRHCEPPVRDRYVQLASASLENASLGQYQALVQKVLAALAAQNAGTEKSSLVGQALKYMDAHLGDADMTVSSLATKVLFVRPDYFGKLFKKEMNIKPSEYIRDKRMQLARRMLRSGDERVHAICAACGYGDNVQYFCHVFKQVVGVTPSQYREQKGQPST